MNMEDSGGGEDVDEYNKNKPISTHVYCSFQ